MNDEVRCLNCNKRLTLVHWALGNQWVHDPTGQHSDIYYYCQIHVATPPTQELRNQATGLYEFRSTQGRLPL